MNIPLIYFIIGLVLGMIISVIGILRMYLAGTLKKMDSDDGAPYLYLDLDRTPDSIGKYNYVMFKVDFHEQKPQK